jgi:hypothetical protein
VDGDELLVELADLEWRRGGGISGDEGRRGQRRTVLEPEMGIV